VKAPNLLINSGKDWAGPAPASRVHRQAPTNLSVRRMLLRYWGHISVYVTGVTTFLQFSVLSVMGITYSKAALLDNGSTGIDLINH